MRNLSLGRRHLVNAYEVEAGTGVIAGNTVWSMPELECEVLQKARYINTLTFTFLPLDSGSLQVGSQPKSFGLVWGFAVAWCRSIIHQNEPGELSRLCHDDSSINIGICIIIIIIIFPGEEVDLLLFRQSCTLFVQFASCFSCWNSLPDNLRKALSFYSSSIENVLICPTLSRVYSVH